MVQISNWISPAIAALGAALFFGASTPFAKQFLNQISPVLVAGLLYAGSGLGLFIIRFLRDRGWGKTGLEKSSWLWLAGSIIFGGIFGPILLMTGLQQTSAANASLLLNLESVLTALLAWVVFKEHTDFWIVLGMIIIVIGGILLSWPRTNTVEYDILGPLAIAGACLCWAIDNNLTRKISIGDALFIAASKGAIAGLVNIFVALGFSQQFPAWMQVSAVLTIGFFGYGASLVLFVLALRGLGTARTGAYFSTAPFIGAAISILFFHEVTSDFFWIAFMLMAIGVGLHLTERHTHEHLHEELYHSHAHKHDEHHQHDHDFPWDGHDSHTHHHSHKPIKHAHQHYPDVHHRHKHK